MSYTTSLFAIDWGTTSARAYRLGRSGEVLDERSALLGISKIQDGRFAEAFVELLGDWQTLAVPRIACGMIGSRQGWIEAPYVDCPASLDSLSGGVIQSPGKELWIVPGLITRDSRGTPDVMRGEETQLLGTFEPDDKAVAVLPGTHSKWAIVDRGTVSDFATFMTGEIFSVLISHSLLGRMASSTAFEVPSDAFDRGVQHGLASGGLTHDLFAARTLALTNQLSGDEVAPWLSGLLIGREIRDARAWIGEDVAVTIIGQDRLCDVYARAFELAEIASRRGPADAAVRGLWRLAKQSRLIS